MPDAGGSWNLTEAIITQWRTAGLDARFRAYWPDPDSRYEVLQDGDEARPNTPSPYCMFAQFEGTPIERSSGKTASTLREIIAVPVTFRVHAQNTTGSRALSGKEIARNLIKLVAEAYDTPALTVPEPDAHLQTIREGDQPAREGDLEWSWTLRYTFILDREAQRPAYHGSAQ